MVFSVVSIKWFMRCALIGNCFILSGFSVEVLVHAFEEFAVLTWEVALEFLL
jgi:hypothetical protein